METYIQISELNDFIFCPKSIFWHHLYAKYSSSSYHEYSQKRGSIYHKAIDDHEYSSASYFLQWKEVFSQKYGICWKIDLLDTRSWLLIERKYKISTIYDGYLLQLRAQYFCLIEMGHRVERLALHSLSDNKRYFFDPPDREEVASFEKLLENFSLFSMKNNKEFSVNSNKCAKCVYRHLCDSCPEDLVS